MSARAGHILAGAGALAVLATLPLWGGTPYGLELGITAATFTVLSTGLNLVYGYTGLLSFAQVAFFGIGGYTSALLSHDAGWPVFAGALVGGVLALLLGLVIGYTSLRLSRHAFAIVSLSFALLCLIISRDWVSLTRGPMGVPGLIAPTLQLPGLGRIGFDRPAVFYWLMLSYAVLVVAATHRLVRSRIGRAFIAIKLNQPLAESQGIDPLRHRLLAIGVSALTSGIAGGFYVFHLTIVDPSIFDFYYTETMLIMVIVGGPGSFWGVVVASLAFTAIPDMLRFSHDLRMVLYGAILIGAMLAFPRGVGGWAAQRRLVRLRRPILA
ncbi:MAG TPA: branched-chain amino acid ABC transporter permease [Stellaceae bacterium]|nr:branched-chain amino acid ABC transporter permease [Stellaceae bacterium]